MERAGIITIMRETTEYDNQNQPGTPQMLRSMNEHALLEHLWQIGPRSRAQLARETGLSKPTVSQALAHLEDAGLVRAIGQVSSERGGRQAVLYDTDPTAGYVVGLDVGRRWVRVAAADLAGSIVARSEILNQAQSAEALVAVVTDLAHTVVAEAGFTWSHVIHTVIGTPGVYNLDEKRFLFASNLPEWGKSGLIALLHEELSSSFTIDNDANLAAVGEHMFGVGTDVENFAFLTVGTGVGLGIIINGSLYRGAHGSGGEISFLPLRSPHGAHISGETSATYRGILEVAASADGVVDAALRLGMSPPLTAEGIFAAARNGDEIAHTVVEYEGEQLALAVASISAMLDPSMIVLGGGIGRNLDLLREPIEQYLREITPFRPRLVASALGNDVILMGAIATALNVARKHVFEQRAQR
ncbi:MAG TPA: ROK family transcriptional regulator [Ktedonobacteraceae bacterium]|nr:ROK family transcriptional regulator [Ktedonobacteraceae bacterium]